MTTHTIVRREPGMFSASLKRTLDITASLTALILLSPVMIVVAAAIRLESTGNVIYGALRAGKGYKRFRLLKFRAVYIDADKQ